MTDYNNPQTIWDRWVEVSNAIQPRYDELMAQGDLAKAEPHRKRLEAMWDLTQKDLVLAALMKYLGVNSSEQTITEEG